MQQTHLSFEVAYATMKSIAAYTPADLDVLGVSPEDLKLAHGETMWQREHRRRVVTVLDALTFGTLDAIGVGRFQVPAEYVASIIATFVAPQNRLIACMWMAEQGTVGGRAADLAVAGQVASTVDKATPTELFALICLLHQKEESTAVRQAFSDRMNTRMRKASGLA